MYDREQQLIELAIKHNSDKHGHHFYMKHYAKFLPERCRSLLEIGIAAGASALIWDDFYKKDCDLHFLDLFLDPNHVSPRWCRERNFVPHQGDQSDLHALAAIKEKFGVIIDDGSHRADHMLISFKHLFLNNSVEGGLYVIEDLACNKNEFYYGGEVSTFEQTPLWMFQNYLQTGKIVNPYFNETESEIYENLIGEVHIEENEEIVFIYRK